MSSVAAAWMLRHSASRFDSAQQVRHGGFGRVETGRVRDELLDEVDGDLVGVNAQFGHRVTR